MRTDARSRAVGDRGGSIGEGWQLGALVAVGGMARIHAVNGRHGRAALKLLRPRRGREHRCHASMLHEASALTEGANPLLVELLDHGVWEGQPFLVLEWLEGPSLGQLLANRRRLPLARVGEIFRRLLAALGGLHARGVVHADLKPDNAMLVRDADGHEVVKLIDLGAACVHGSLGVWRDEVTGTPGYLAPEIVNGARPDPTTDVYAAGVMLSELLTGVSPFPGSELATVVAQQLHPVLPAVAALRADVPTDVAAGLDRVIAAALAPDPQRRPRGMAALRRAFDDAVADPLPIDAERDGVPAHASELPTSSYRR